MPFRTALRLATATLLVALALPPAASAQEAPADVEVGPLVISGYWTRATPPGAPTAAGYLTILNRGAASDRLVAVATPAAGKAEIHEMSVVDNRMTMRQIEGGLEIRGGEQVVLEPSGTHLMFVGVTQPPVQGGMLPVTLTFEQAGTVELALPVFPIGSKGPAGVEAAAAGHAHHGAEAHQ